MFSIKISNLKINTDDVLNILEKLEKIFFNLNSNFFLR